LYRSAISDAKYHWTQERMPKKNSAPWIQHGQRPQDCANPETLLKTNLNLPTDFAEEPDV